MSANRRVCTRPKAGWDESDCQRPDTERPDLTIQTYPNARASSPALIGHYFFPGFVGSASPC
jgi:hypothetical protein